ncbi:MAG: GGDEF domain-containing protein [Isosphaeraceae bacterium]
MTDDKCSTQISSALALAEFESPPDSHRTQARPTYLIVVGGGIPGTMIRLHPGVTVVGRAGENAVRVPDLSVSRRHAEIEVDRQGMAWLTDLGSTNGTFLNKSRLPPHTPTPVEDGDRIQLGSCYVVKFVSLDPCDERFQRELFERSVRDPLTGLYNRAFFLEQLHATAQAGAAKGLGLALLMLDVDHFKRVNDDHGHDVGDAVLREVAQVLRECTRSEDLVARFGGEEFVLALPAAAPDQATERAERIRAEIASREVTAGGRLLQVTASLGLTFAWPGRARSADDLMRSADLGLYQAKHGGRNRVVLRAETHENDRDNDRSRDSSVLTPMSEELRGVRAAGT